VLGALLAQVVDEGRRAGDDRLAAVDLAVEEPQGVLVEAGAAVGASAAYLVLIVGLERR